MNENLELIEKKENYIHEKAKYCLNCKIKPCSSKGCPLNNDIPAFIEQVLLKNYKEAYKILTKTTVLPAICGRICPHSKQCQGSCVRGIKGEPVGIGEIESFVGDWALENNCKIDKYEKQDLQGEKIAVIGGGPAGLTVAAFLARRGANVTIYERYDYLGGLLVYGIPEFRLSKKIVKKSIEKILELGIEVKYNSILGENLNLQELKQEYDNIILAFGANVSSKMKIEGENLKGVYGGNELLEYNLHPNYEGKTVLVNGGGNVAIDVARTVKKLGANKVIVVYRRARQEMPAEQKEIEDAIKDGVEFLFQNNILKIYGNKKDEVSGVELIKTELIKKEGETRLFPINIENSNYDIRADYVMMALGSHTDSFVKTLGLELTSSGHIKTNEFGQTSDEKIYAIGDVAKNISTVAYAARSGREIFKGEKV